MPGQSVSEATTVIVDATRAVNLHPGDDDAAVRELESNGIRVIKSKKL